jgi:hypothetical protein
MADDLVFKVKFDLQKGVEEALKDGDKALDRIEKVLGKHPITIKLRMDNRVTRGASAELTGFKKQLAELTQQWNSLTAAERGSAAGAAIREKFRALRTEAQGYTSTLQAAVKVEDKMRESHSKTAASANKLSSAYHNQSTYLSRLIQRMVAYAGISYVGNFLTNVREVTAQFELQRISLGAIIQDQQRANQLFEEIKTFALKSPVKILDLTKYTKQLAAYKIGVDELFDTTKRLTDISVGLGVSMDRIVLMYGQIRATGYLRASEVRQATEAGIPLVEELANKLSKANGELVTAADVMDMISKRAISFDMVKEVFDDMTSAGGIFYNMQEKQGNTLFGMWQKLGDAAAVMYDQIGNTSSVNEGMKMAIQTLRYLMLHWKQVGIVVGGVSVYILANTIATKNNAIATAAATTANKLHIASLQQKLGALRLEQMNLKSTAIFQRLHTAATLSATKAQIGAATSTNVFSKALYGLKAALLSNPLTALAIALTTIITLLMQSESELDKLNSKLQDIDRDYDASGKKSVDRFKELVKAVEENVDGSKAQKEALDELDRTYGKILGSEALELDSLKALGGQYGELIDLIEAYNAKKRGEEKETAIKSSYATILDEEKDDLMDYLNQAGMSAEKQAEFISRLNEKLIEYSGDADAAIKATNETFKEFADDISQLDAAGNIINVLNFDKLADAWGVAFRQAGALFGGQGMDYLYNYARAMEGQNKALEENEMATRNAVRGLDEYAEGIDNVGKALKNLDWSSQEALYNSLQDYNKKNPQTALSVPINLEFDPSKAQSEYEKMIEIGNMQIHAIFANLQNIASQEGVAIPEEFYKQAKSVVEGNKSFSFIDFEGLSKLFTSKKAKQAIAESKLLFESISPNDRTVAVFKTKLAQLASGAGVELSSMTKYFMKAGDNIEDYAKKIKEAIEELEKKLKEMQTTNQMGAEGGHGPLQVFSEEEIKKIQMQVAVLKELFPFLQGFTKGGSGRTSDPRLQNLKEEISLYEKLYQEYKQYEKAVGSSKAAEYMEREAKDTIDALAKKYGIGLPKNVTDLTSALEILYKKMQALPSKVFKNLDKELKEFRWKIEKVDIDESQKNIEAELKRLADRISRTKTAKEFYEKILGMTGDYDLAAKVSLSVYGDTGYDLQKQLAEQIRTYFDNENIKVEIPVDVITADNQINYKRLGEFAEQMKKQLGEEPYKAIKKIAEEGQKDLAKTYEGYLKDLEKAKTYADKRVELARTTAAKIMEIERNPQYTKEQKAELKRGYQEREDREAAKLEYEAFKDTPMYVQMFEDLDNASTTMLRNMRDMLNQLKGKWGETLEPTQLKEMQSRLNAISEQLAKRNPFKAIGDGIGKIRTLNKEYGSLKNVEKELATATKQLLDNKDALTAALQAEAAARAEYDKVVAESGADSAAAKNAKGSLDSATALVNQMRKNVNLTEQEVKLLQEIIDKFKDANNEVDDGFKGIGEYVAKVKEAQDAIKGAVEEWTALGDDELWNTIFDGLDKMAQSAEQGGEAVAAYFQGDYFTMVTKGISSIANLAAGIGKLFWGSKVAKANKEIKRQQELLDQLEYTYGRLEKAADKVFGRDYISNYNQQIRNLQAQADAYAKQAAAERDKGKKADEEKAQEYDRQRRAALDEIADMQGRIAEQMAGTDVASAARDFAQAWLEAYATFGDTTAAIKDKFKDMIKSMVVESVLAKVVQTALQPLFDKMNSMYKSGAGMTDVLSYAMVESAKLSEEINRGLQLAAKDAERAGINLKELYADSDGFTGISKSVAGATSEEINANTAAFTTMSHYVSYMPTISEHVAAIRMMMERGGAPLPSSGASPGGVDYTNMLMTANQHLSSLPRMEQRLGDIYGLLNNLIVYKGGVCGVNSFLRER